MERPDSTPPGSTEQRSFDSVIHPDYPLQFGRFAQNREWDTEVNKGHPGIKAAVEFDDTALLDDNPFITKISKDLKGDHAYFGVAYGRQEDREALKQWAVRFPVAKLFTYDGGFLEQVSGQSAGLRTDNPTQA